MSCKNYDNYVRMIFAILSLKKLNCKMKSLTKSKKSTHDHFTSIKTITDQLSETSIRSVFFEKR